ncbi:MAG: low specificity L-threonine aldolase [Hyphomicrobiaceae bacterium]|nr:low specificity L-threonine aldolase [Hyphomicrobiaceae bacterium]
MRQQFASDNNAGICPAALARFIEANDAGHAAGYGEDRWTRQARERIAALFEADCDVFFVFNGTAANALALAQLCRPYNALIGHAFSHVETDEAGAPEFFTGGAKLMTAGTPLAKLTPEAVESLATRYSGPHHVKPAALSLTQATELGTVYTPVQLRELSAVARRHGLKVHMDGARFANAVARLGCAPADLTRHAGVDVLCFGGVKNGLAVGDCIVFFDRALSDEFLWRIKQAGQLNSKMRLVSAAWLGLLDGGVWLANARHANAMADRLATGLIDVPGVRLIAPVEANAVFAEIAPDLQAALRARDWQFYTFLGATGCRLMCSWDTQASTIDRFLADAAAAARA